jgi:hypothetical protein
MAARRPTLIQYSRTGLYTRRSAQFAPLRVIGLQVQVMTDALIDGQDMELLDTYQLQRRPGFVKICTQQLNPGEIINQFYGHRNSAGTIFPLFDSNQHVATFNSSRITSIWTKSSTNQAFTQMVQDQLYLCNGTANGQKRYDTIGGTLHGLGLPAPAAALMVPAPTAVNATFWQPGVAYSFNGTHGAILFDSNGNIQEARVNGGASGSTPPNWATSFGTSTVEGGQTWLNLGSPGNWAPSTAGTSLTAQVGGVIIDSNGNIQQRLTNGTSSASAPSWATTPGSNTTDGTITWVCKSNLGPLSVFSGYQYMYVYSTQAPTVSGGYYHRSDGSPVTITTGPVFGTYAPVLSGAYSTSTDVGSVDIYRTRDGGSSFDYAGSVPNNTLGGTWNFTDSIKDAALNASLIIPLGTALLSDPPPGQTGTHSPSGDAISFITYWQGRFWAISNNPGGGCKVYFTSGPDVDNGDSFACWPPANVFTFPGQGIALIPTSVGLLVWLNDALKIIAGGPQTLSYFDTDLLDNFGISSPNCVAKDGDTVTALLTSGQVFTLNVSSKTEISAFIADIVQTFPENSSYLAYHRNGLDNGLFLGDGSTNVLRYGLNVNSWSPIYKPVGGIKALNSIETSVGNYTLCAGRATAAGWILGRAPGVVQDDGANYSACFATIGNIVLSQPLEPLVPVFYVAGYFAAGGSIPTVSILPNEITGSTGPGFVTLPDVQDEPSLGMTASTTLMAKQWDVKCMPNMRNSWLMHHLQVKISFPAENFASTIYGIALQHDQNG